MTSRRAPWLIVAVLAAASMATAAAPQSLPFLHRNPPPPPTAPPDAPPPDPKTYWQSKEPPVEERFDPLGGRRMTRAETASARRIDNGVDPLLYRLWGLQPIQSQLVRQGEVVLEVWARPSGDVRQAVVRVTVRRDGRAFVQARAGLGCCKPQIDRRVDIDQELAAGSAAAFEALAQDAVWSQPEDAVVLYKGAGAVEALCAGGVSYDLTLVTEGAARHLRRSCDTVAVGSVAAVLGPVIMAALGRNPLFDDVFPRGADFAADAEAYRAFAASGGRLAPRPR